MTSSPPILDIADFIADPVDPADFPECKVRYWNTRWATALGLDDMDSGRQAQHFGRFDPLRGNLERPLALRYHGHQFGTYNPQLGDGRGFLFAQLRDSGDRWLDLGTKGSGQTPWSRQGDGRLTLKGGVREILAANYLEALGVNTSKPFALIETGEQLARNDEPSPTRSAVLTRLSHSHIRFGSFQRLAYLEQAEELARLVDYVVQNFYPEAADADTGQQAVNILRAVSSATGHMIGQWMAAGFVHGVMNTDNFNITGETFDFGPWRFLPVSDPNFTAAYFDQQGLYRFGRQPLQGGWALQQLASALLPVADADKLATGLTPYERAYQDSFAGHTHALLGLAPLGEPQADTEFLQAFYAWMTESGASWPQTFFDWFGGRESTSRAAASPQAALYTEDRFAPVRAGLTARTPDRPGQLNHAYFQAPAPVSLLIDEVEAVWAPIAETDDWSALHAKLDHIEQARLAYDWA
jgi:protein adenylyltransferase